MGGKSKPDTPDYRGAAEQTAEGNLQNLNLQTWANRPAINTPWGSISWDTNAVTDPATGQQVTQWTQNVGLNPDQQESLSQQQRLGAQRSGLAGGMYSRIEEEFGNPVDWSQYNPLGAAPDPERMDAAMRYYDEANDAIYGQWSDRMEPRMENQMAAQEAALRNQGLTPGTEAYDYALQQLRQSQNDARQQAQYQATIGAGAEANRMLGMDMSSQGQYFQQGMMSANYQNQLRQQQIAEDMMKRGYTLNEVNAILTGQQVGMPQQPGFTNAGYVGGPDYTGAARDSYQADLDRFNADQMGLQGLYAGPTQMASAYLGRG